MHLLVATLWTTEVFHLTAVCRLPLVCSVQAGIRASSVLTCPEEGGNHLESSFNTRAAMASVERASTGNSNCRKTPDPALQFTLALSLLLFISLPLPPFSLTISTYADTKLRTARLQVQVTVQDTPGVPKKKSSFVREQTTKPRGSHLSHHPSLAVDAVASRSLQ